MDFSTAFKTKRIFQEPTQQRKKSIQEFYEMDKYFVEQPPASPKLAINDRRIDNSLRIEAWDLDMDLFNKKPKLFEDNMYPNLASHVGIK